MSYRVVTPVPVSWKFWTSLLLGTILSVWCFISASSQADFGFGSYRQFKILFPFMLLVGQLSGLFPLLDPARKYVGLVSVFQMSFYGAVVGLAWVKGRWRILLVLSLVHGVASLLVFVSGSWR